MSLYKATAIIFAGYCAVMYGVWELLGFPGLMILFGATALLYIENKFR